ncbi:MAG: hypothetical protein ACT6RL_08490 [Neoaquamicrobium sediminum]|uniref:hypothetical protein n=1 Tax=Neoaquamicrobium sediminum TaxID=1849104 RepID=UPI004035D37C
MSIQTTVGDTATSPRPWQHLAVLRERARGRFKPTLLTRIERYGIRRDLSVPRDLLPTRVPIALRPMTHADVDILFPEDATALSPKDQQEVVWRRMFIDKAGIANGIVGVDERNGRLCAALWRFWHSDNALVRRIGGFPHLCPDDILIEGHYAPRPYRGVGVMPVVTEMVAREAAAAGLRYMHGFVGTRNRPSLKSARRIGFEPHLLHTRRFRLFGLLVDDRFDVFPDEDPRRRWEL